MVDERAAGEIPKAAGHLHRGLTAGARPARPPRFVELELHLPTVLRALGTSLGLGTNVAVHVRGIAAPRWPRTFAPSASRGPRETARRNGGLPAGGVECALPSFGLSFRLLL